MLGGVAQGLAAAFGGMQQPAQGILQERGRTEDRSQRHAGVMATQKERALDRESNDAYRAEALAHRRQADAELAAYRQKQVGIQEARLGVDLERIRAAQNNRTSNTETWNRASAQAWTDHFDSAPQPQEFTMRGITGSEEIDMDAYQSAKLEWERRGAEITRRFGDLSSIRERLSGEPTNLGPESGLQQTARDMEKQLGLSPQPEWTPPLTNITNPLDSIRGR